MNQFPNLHLILTSEEGAPAAPAPAVGSGTTQPSAPAQEQAAMPEAPGLLAQLFPILLIFVIFYFLLIRPQQKRAKEHQKMLDALKKDDEVVTAGGVYGRITALTDAVATVEIAPNVRIKVQRGQIAVVKAPETGSKEKEKDKA